MAYEELFAQLEAGLTVVDQFGSVITDPIAAAIQNDLNGVGNTASSLEARLGASFASQLDLTTQTLQYLQDTFGMSGQTALDLASQAGYEVSQIIRNDLAGYTNTANDTKKGIVNLITGGIPSALDKAGQVISGVGGEVGGVLKAGTDFVTGLVSDIPSLVPDILGPLVAPFEAIGAALSPLKLIGELKRLFDMIKTTIDDLSDITNWSESPELSSLIKGKVDFMGRVGALVGSPMGFLPVLGDAYSSGIGELIKNESRSLLQPTRLSLPDYTLALKRGEITPQRFVSTVPDLGYSWEDVEVIRKLTRQLMGASDLTTLWRRGELLDKQLQAKLEELAITDDDIELTKKLTRYMLSINDLISLWLRGELREEELNPRLLELGVREEDAKQLRKLAYFIPGVQDLIHMAVREAFTPEIAVKFGQYEDFPEAFAEYGKKHGLSREWAERYWASHWELPGISQAFEMYFRTTFKPTKFSGEPIGQIDGRPYYKAVDWENLNLLLKALDVMPPWRDALLRIAETPFTRVDIRRMHKVKLLTRDDVYKAYLDIGYHPDKAEKLTSFTIELNKEEEKLEKAPERDLTTSEVISAYANVLIDKPDATTLLTALGYEQSEIDFKLALAELPGIKRIRTKQIDIIKQRVVYEVIDLNGAVDLLNKLDLPPFEMEYQLLDIQMDMELAKIKKQAAAKKAHEAAVKAAATKAEAAAAAAAKAAKITPRDLAKTDIFAAYGYDIISLAVVKILLTKAGFDDAEIAILIQTYESKAKQTKDKLEAAIAKQRSAKKAKGSS